MSYIVDYVKSSLYTGGASQQARNTGTKAPFSDPQNLEEEFLVDLQYVNISTKHRIWIQ